MWHLLIIVAVIIIALSLTLSYPNLVVGGYNDSQFVKFRRRLGGGFMHFLGKFTLLDDSWRHKIHQAKSDDDLEELLRSIPKRPLDSSYRADKRMGQISKVIAASGVTCKPVKYLDVGCGNGTITSAIGSKLGATETFGVDILAESSPEIKYTRLKTNKLPYDSGSIDLVTSLQSLHHVKDLDLMLDEIHRVARSNAVWIVREHDASPDIYQLIDSEHAIPSIMAGESYADFRREYYAKYMSQTDLLNRLRQRWDVKYVSPSKGPTKYYMAVLTKRN